MKKVNYIFQLNIVLEMFHNDERIKQGHITLYLALFQKWNRKFFKKRITINREQIMERAKIKSKTTYHNHLRDLDTWEYLKYFPSYHPAIGSKIGMTNYCPIIDTSSGISTGTQKVQNLAISVPEPSQNLVPYYKHKTKENLNKRQGLFFDEKEVLLYFKTNNWPEKEARKFFAYIQSQKWKSKDNWQKAAFLFVQNGFKMPNKKSARPISGYLSNLRKNYDEPL